MEEPRPVPWHVADLAAFATAFLAAQILVPLIFSLLLRLIGVKFDGAWLLIAQGLSNLTIVAFACFVIRLHGQSIRETLRWVPSNTHVGRLISKGVFLALSILLANFFFASPKASPLERFLSTPQSIATLVILGIVVAPITEEVLFRGFLYRVLEELYGSLLAVRVTTAAFAGLHFLQLWGNWAAMILIVVVGYILTMTRMRTNSLKPSFVMHTAYNTMIFGVGALSWLVQRS